MNADRLAQLETSLAPKAKIGSDEIGQTTHCGAVLERLAMLLRLTPGPAFRIDVDAAGLEAATLAAPSRLNLILLAMAEEVRAQRPRGGHLRITAYDCTQVAEASSAAPEPRYDDAGYVVARGQGGGEEDPAASQAGFVAPMLEGWREPAALCPEPRWPDMPARTGWGMRVERRSGVGCMVGLWLPRAATAYGPSGLDRASGIVSEGGRSVLLVDDDDLVRPVIADSLREAGYDVMEAADAAQAIAMIHGLQQLDLLISDVVMPGMDGPTMVAKLRSERPDLRVLFITGHAGKYSLAGERVLRKPFTNRELTRAVVASMGATATR